jgi:hypothetical protein
MVTEANLECGSQLPLCDCRYVEVLKPLVEPTASAQISSHFLPEILYTLPNFSPAILLLSDSA